MNDPDKQGFLMKQGHGRFASGFRQRSVTQEKHNVHVLYSYMYVCAAFTVYMYCIVVLTCMCSIYSVHVHVLYMYMYMYCTCTCTCTFASLFTIDTLLSRIPDSRIMTAKRYSIIHLFLQLVVHFGQFSFCSL